jgi:hypothetical protein
MHNIKNINANNANPQPTTNLARLHRLFDRAGLGVVVVQVDFEFIYTATWFQDENGADCLLLESEGFDGLGGKVFSSAAIEKGKFDKNTITMTAEDGQEYDLAFFTMKAAML